MPVISRRCVAAKTAWFEKFQDLDQTAVLKDTTNFQTRLESLLARLDEAKVETINLESKIPLVEAEFDESLLNDAVFQAAAQKNFEKLFAAIKNSKKKTDVIRATLALDRTSPELQKMAGELWESCAGFRSTLVDLYPEAQAELVKAQALYLQTVGRIGEIGTKISRLEILMNKVAGPFLKDRKYQQATPTPVIHFDQEAVATAFDPDRKLALKINPGVLDTPHPTAETALAVLRGNS